MPIEKLCVAMAEHIMVVPTATKELIIFVARGVSNGTFFHKQSTDNDHATTFIQ